MTQMPIGAAIRWQAERDPHRPAITEIAGPAAPVDERTVTRLELELRTNRLARTYERLGVAEGDFVTIGLPNGIAAVGFDDGDVGDLVAGTMQQQRLLATCPLTVTEDDAAGIFRRSMQLW